MCSLLHGMSGSPDLARASTLSCEVPTFLNRAQSAQLRSPDRLAVIFKAIGANDGVFLLTAHPHDSPQGLLGLSLTQLRVRLEYRRTIFLFGRGENRRNAKKIFINNVEKNYFNSSRGDSHSNRRSCGRVASEAFAGWRSRC